MAQAKQLETAVRFCEELGAPEKVNVDDMLRRMEELENQKGLFRQWVDDYQRFAKSQKEKTFTFLPDLLVTNPEEFTLALCRYGAENNLNLVITKECIRNLPLMVWNILPRGFAPWHTGFR